MHSSDIPAERSRFETYYAAPQVPWDIGRPQPAFIAVADSIQGRVLDVGCGTGELALWLAERGCAVTGVDFLEDPLEAARDKARARGLAVTDCGLFHVFDDGGRAAYVAALTELLEPGSQVFLLCFSTAEPGPQGPRRISAADLQAAFARGWQIESIEPALFETVPGIPGAEFTPGGARALFAVIRRAG